MLTLWLFVLVAAPSDSFEMREIARVPYFPVCRYACGDADHDGRQEFCAMGLREQSWRNYILEYNNGVQFDTFPLGYEHAKTWEFGDGDRDGRTDLVLDYTDSLTGRTLTVLESVDSASLPSIPVWSVPVPEMPTYLRARFTDIDGDSAREVTFSARRSDRDCIEVYECVAPDSYGLVDRVYLRENANESPVDLVQTFDLDRDGLPELAVGTDDGLVYFLEAVSGESLVVKNTVRIGAFRDLVYAVAAAPDMDRDGKPEVIALDVDYRGGGVLAVIESPGNDSFEIVWSTRLLADFLYDNSIDVGDVDGDSVPEFVVADGYSWVRLFRCTGNDRYEQFWQTSVFRWGTAALYDINSDGKAELLYHDEADGHWTVIREYFSLGIGERRLAEVPRVDVGPVVAVRGQVVRVTGQGRVEVVDATGRVVAVSDGLWDTGSVVPGAYFVRVAHRITRKILVVE